jgi:hypothetical protein
MTPADLSARHEALQREEWHKPGGTDGGQNVRALARLVEEALVEERHAIAGLAKEHAADHRQMADRLHVSDERKEILEGMAMACDDLEEQIRARSTKAAPGEPPSISAEINALPERLRRYIHDLETNADPAGTVRDAFAQRENCKALEAELVPLRRIVSNIENYLENAGPFEDNPLAESHIRTFIEQERA